MRRALKASIPILFGYVPLGIAFGLLFSRLGHPWWTATLSALIVYAGAAQYLSIGLLAAGAGLVEVFVATLTLNLRHVFYGFSLMNRFPERGLRRLYMIFGLTDETYSVITATPPADDDAEFCFWLTLFNHAYWTAGCTAGAVIGGGLTLELKGLEFVLAALFIVLTVEQARATRKLAPFAAAAAGAAVALAAAPGQMLVVAMATASALLLAAGRARA